MAFSKIGIADFENGPGIHETFYDILPHMKYPLLTLRPLRMEDETEVDRIHQELMDSDRFEFVFRDQGESWADYLKFVEQEAKGVGLPPSRVPATFLVAEVQGEIVGRVSIRHELNEYLARVGGHIGYAVRPQHRLKGYAREILRQALEITRSLGLTKVLLTCDDSNVGSIKTIEACNGVLEDVVAAEDGTLKRRYWITL